MLWTGAWMPIYARWRRGFTDIFSASALGIKDLREKLGGIAEVTGN
jgi:hypothetical protein